MRGDQKNWRQRIDALKQSNDQIGGHILTNFYVKKYLYFCVILGGIYEETLKKLTQVADEIGSDLDKTKSRERLINQQMTKLVTDLRTAHDKLAQAKVRLISH